jgi:hypothetical protein
LLLLSSLIAAKDNRVIVGTLTYLGTNQFGSVFRVTLDPKAFTSQPLSFANVTMLVEGTKQDSGPVITPVTILYVGGEGSALASCANGCASISVRVVSKDGKAFTFTLKNSEEFQTFGVTTTVMRKLPGQRFIQPQQSVPLVLKRNASGKDCSPPCKSE